MDYLGSYRTLIYLFFFAWLTVIIHRIFIYDITNHAWILGDWLINYEDGGFKRRGISGSLLFCLYNLTGIRLQLLVFLAQFTFYLLFLFYWCKLLIDREISLVYLFFILSPLTFMFCINNLTSVGRKEVILFSLFSYFIYCLSSDRLSKNREAVVLVLIFVSCFFHEIIFFYVPYFVVALVLFRNHVNWIRCSLYFFAAFIPLVLIGLFGGDINQGETMRILVEKGVVIKGGIIEWPNYFDTFSYYKSYLKNYSLYGVSFILGLLHVFFLLKELGVQQKIIRYFFVMILGCCLFTIPVFVLAVDWGRWLYIHFTLILLIITLFLNRKNKTEKVYKFNFRYVNLKIYVFLTFLLLWNMESYRMGFSFKGILYKLVIKFNEVYYWLF